MNEWGHSWRQREGNLSDPYQQVLATLASVEDCAPLVLENDAWLLWVLVPILIIVTTYYEAKQRVSTSEAKLTHHDSFTGLSLATPGAQRGSRSERLLPRSVGPSTALKPRALPSLYTLVRSLAYCSSAAGHRGPEMAGEAEHGGVGGRLSHLIR